MISHALDLASVAYVPCMLYAAILHLLYARFITHFLYSIGMVPEKEPFKQLVTQVDIVLVFCVPWNPTRSSHCPSHYLSHSGNGPRADIQVPIHWALLETK